MRTPLLSLVVDGDDTDAVAFGVESLQELSTGSGRVQFPPGVSCSAP